MPPTVDPASDQMAVCAQILLFALGQITLDRHRPWVKSGPVGPVILSPDTRFQAGWDPSTNEGDEWPSHERSVARHFDDTASSCGLVW